MPYTITDTTPNIIRCHLAAMEQEARRQGCRMDWSLDEVADGSLNSDIYPPSQRYFHFDMTASGHGFHSGCSTIYAAGRLTGALEQARTIMRQYTDHIAAMRRNNQPLQATFNF